MRVDSQATPATDRDMAGQSAGIVSVTKGSIRSVLSFDSELVSRPRYEVLAPDSGIFESKTSVGEIVEPREILGILRRGVKSIEIVAETRARVDSIAAQNGEDVPSGIALLELEARGFALKSVVAPSDRYRLTSVSPNNTVRASIDKGPGPFACPLLGGPQRGEGGELTLLCAIPSKLRVFAGLQGIMAVSLEQKEEALLLPISAVAGSADTGQVSLIDDSGKITTRDVILGITDGLRIEIRSGLVAGQKVSGQAPSSVRPRDDGDERRGSPA